MRSSRAQLGFCSRNKSGAENSKGYRYARNTIYPLTIIYLWKFHYLPPPSPEDKLLSAAAAETRRLKVTRRRHSQRCAHCVCGKICYPPNAHESSIGNVFADGNKFIGATKCATTTQMHTHKQKTFSIRTGNDTHRIMYLYDVNRKCRARVIGRLADDKYEFCQFCSFFCVHCYWWRRLDQDYCWCEKFLIILESIQRITCICCFCCRANIWAASVTGRILKELSPGMGGGGGGERRCHLSTRASAIWLLLWLILKYFPPQPTKAIQSDTRSPIGWALAHLYSHENECKNSEMMKKNCCDKCYYV